MTYVQFFYVDLAGKVSEACGDRSVVILDGRCRRSWMEATALAECRKRKYVAWQLCKGETFTRSAPITSVQFA